MRISIAIATYNGEKHLREQLDSFLRQTRLPDEIVFSDDGSTDSTLEILERFKASASFEVRIHRNEQRLGYSGNFDRAIQQCSGELIFLSDQDDVWFPEKLEWVARRFEEDRSLLVLINDCAIVHGDLGPTGLTKLGQVRSAQFSDALFVTGCCTCFRGELKQIICPIPDLYAYDTWIHRVGMTLGGRMIFPQVLQYYRRHGQNTSAASVSSTQKLGALHAVSEIWSTDAYQMCRRRLEGLDILERRMQEASRSPDTGTLQAQSFECTLAKIHDEKRALEDRLDVLNRDFFRRLLPALQLFLRGKYQYFSGWKSLLRDCLHR